MSTQVNVVLRSMNCREHRRKRLLPIAQDPHFVRRVERAACHGLFHRQVVREVIAIRSACLEMLQDDARLLRVQRTAGISHVEPELTR